MMKKVLFISLFLIVGVCLSAQTYQQVTNVNPQFNNEFTFTNGINSNAGTAIFTDSGLPVNGNQHSIIVGEPFTIKIPNGFKYYDGTIYDTYMKIKPRISSSSNVWGFFNNSSHLILYHGQNDGTKDFDFEIWLQNGTEIVDHIDIIGGSCFMGPGEGARPWSDDGFIYTNVDSPQTIWRWEESTQSWRTNNESVTDNIHKYILGHGTSTNNSIKGGYQCNWGFAEFVLGYLTKNVTFRAVYEETFEPIPINFSYVNPQVFTNNILKVAVNKPIGTPLPTATLGCHHIIGWYIGNDTENILTDEQLMAYVVSEDITVTAIFSEDEGVDVTISGNPYVNAGESVTLTASGADIYQWSTGETGSSITVSPTENTTYSVVGTDENGCSDTAYFTIRLRVNVGIPVYVAMRDTSDCHIDGHHYSFKLESLTLGAPMPENDIVDIEAPTIRGIAGKNGYDADDNDNPWRMAFEAGTWNYKISQVLDSVPTADTLDNGYWVVSMLITPDSIQKWEIISAEYNVPVNEMVESSFHIVKAIESGQYETAVQVSVDELGRTRLKLGGDDINDIAEGVNAYNTAIIKSKFDVDFTRKFIAIGSLTPPPATTPDGTLVGFIANPTAPTPEDITFGGLLGIYNSLVFNYGIVLEFDSYINNSQGSNNNQGLTDPNYKHFSLEKVNDIAMPNSTGQLYDMTNCWPESECNYSIVNDPINNTLTFNLTLPDSTIQTYIYNNPSNAFNGTTTAYLIMSGVVRRGPSGIHNLGPLGSPSPSLEMYFDSFNYIGQSDGFEDTDCIFVNYLGHEWTYSAASDTLKVICAHDNHLAENNACTNPDFKNLIITAEDMNHDGSIYDKASYTTDEWTENGFEIPVLEYAGDGITVFAQSTIAPSECGTYKALATVNDTVTAFDNFNIKPLLRYDADEHATAFVRFINDSLIIPDSTFVNPYDSLVATASVEESWHFKNWTNGLGGVELSTNSIYKFRIDRDTIVYANTEKDSYHIYLTDTACVNEGYHEKGFEIDSLSVGLNYDTLYLESMVYGCDSTVYLELHAMPIYDSTFYDTICYGNGHHEHGFEIDPLELEVGMNYDTLFLATTLGCDSIVKLELYVAPIYDSTFYDTICYGNGYHEHGFEIDPFELEVGMNYDTLFLATTLGCDSTVYLELYVAPVYDSTFYDTICYGNGYHEHGFEIEPSSVEVGMNYDTLFLATTLGCDSTVYLELYVAPVYDSTFYDTICYGNGYHQHGFEIDSLSLELGMNYDTLFLATTLGCDSTVYLELYVAPIYDSTFYDTICYGNGYHEHGFEIDSLSLEVGMNYDTLFLETVLHCDSLVYLELYVAPIYDSTFYDTICYGSGYHQHGFEIDSLSLEVGMNYDTLFLETVLHCDSLVYLELYVAPVYDSTLFDTICYGNGYHEHGFEIDSLSLEVGMNYDTLFLETILHCDSIVKLELFVTPVLDTTFYDSICYGNSYYEHGFEIDDPGLGMNYDTLFLATTLGCDSTVYLELFVAPVYDSTFYDTICYGNGYHEHGFEIDSLSLEVGMNYDTLFLATILHCDSIVKLELFVAPIYDSTFFDTICYGNGYHQHGFEIDSLELEVGMNYDTLLLATTLGCDSIVKLELYVAAVYDSTFQDVICHGNGYHQHGFELDSLELELGMNYDTLFLATTLGCDSTVYLELYVAPLYDTTFIDTTCINLGYHEHGFDLEDLELGWNYDTLFLASIYGCDSTVYLELYAVPVFDTTFYDTICYGNGYHEHGFEIEPSSLVVGMNFDTINPGTIFGCDSISYLELYVAPVYDIKLYDSICFGEDYHNHGFDFEQPEIGNHSETHNLATIYTCDSIVTMNLFVGEVYDITIKDTICFGEDYDKYNFHLVNPPLGTNTESQSLSSIYGCDSTVNLRLYVAPIYSFDVIDSICEGEDYNNYGLFIPQPVPGVYNYTSTLATELGCDSIFNVNFKVIYTFEEPDTLYGLRFVHVSTNMLPGMYKYWIDTITGCNEYHWEIDNDKWLISPDENGCVITVTTPEVSTLTVFAGNSCGTVYKSVEISAEYFGVGENEITDVNVYPNPSSGYVNVESNGVEVINILSATGVVVKRFKFDDENLVSIDISDLPNAVYMLEIVTRDGKCMRRITKTAY